MEDLQKIIDETEFYHSIEINNIKIKGYYNWEPYFGLIKNLFDFKNKKVLDVGPADGYFSQKFYSLGALVEAVDIPSQIDRDHYNFGKLNKNFNHWKKKSNHNFNFKIFNKIYNNNIELHFRNIYDLENLNKLYDLVFCNDLLLHLTDPIKAIDQLTKVSNEYVLIGNPIIKKNFFNRNKSEVNYLGHTKKNAFYIFNEVGFINLIETFRLKIEKKIIIYPSQKDFFSNMPRMFILAKKD